MKLSYNKKSNLRQFHLLLKLSYENNTHKNFLKKYISQLIIKEINNLSFIS